MIVRPEIHTRCNFAAREYNRLVDLQSSQGLYITSHAALKIEQAYRIYCHYRDEFQRAMSDENKSKNNL